jgi:hypothetical protein
MRVGRQRALFVELLPLKTRRGRDLGRTARHLRSGRNGTQSAAEPRRRLWGQSARAGPATRLRHGAPTRSRAAGRACASC